MALRKITTETGEVYSVNVETEEIVKTETDVAKSELSRPNINVIEKAKIESNAYEKDKFNIESFKKEKQWFIEVEAENGEKLYYCREDLSSKLRTGILEGKYSKNNKIVIHQKDKDGNWQQSETTLYKIVKGNFNLRILYQPVWGHAIAGLKWGAFVGIALKLFDTLLLLFTVDPTLAVLFLASIIVVLIPRFGMIGVIAIVFFSMKYTGANLFLMGLGAALVGAALGCLPGMAIGGIVGLIKKRSILLAKDASPEPAGLILRSVILPFISGLTLIGLYIFVINPWIINSLG